MAYQDEVYLRIEANAFFERCVSGISLGDGQIRPEKKTILVDIVDCLGDRIAGSKVLEIGCFIGDLLASLSREYGCSVVGVEPSSLACEYAENKFQLSLLNNIYTNTNYFHYSEENFNLFDVIVLDDVLSWMPRETILPVIGSIDWLLKPGGFLLIRDFCPSVDFAFPNHHQKDKDVYNYKVSGGHKKFFLSTGSYLIHKEHVRNTSAFQAIVTDRVDSMIWSDSILMKVPVPLHPRIPLS